MAQTFSLVIRPVLTVQVRCSGLPFYSVARNKAFEVFNLHQVPFDLQFLDVSPRLYCRVYTPFVVPIDDSVVWELFV